MLYRSMTALLALLLLGGCAPAYVRRMDAGDAALRQGRYEAARLSYERAAAQAAAARAPGARLAEAENGRAAASMLLGRPADAEAAYRAALGHLKDGPVLARAATLSDLAYVCALQGRSGEAAALYRRSLEDYSRAPGAPALEEAARWSELGQLELAQRDFVQAQKAYERALALREKAAGSADASLAPVLQDLASALEGQGKLAEAQAASKRARALGGAGAAGAAGAGGAP